MKLLRSSAVWMCVLSLVAFGCSGDPDPVDVNNDTPVENNQPGENNRPGDDLNACGGESELVYEGAAADPGDGCGECGGGVLECDGENALVCAGADALNACGGCEVLEAQPGEPCSDIGRFECTVEGSVACVEVELPQVVLRLPEFSTPEEIEEHFEVGTTSAVFKASFEGLPEDVQASDHGFCWSLEPGPTLATAQCASLGPVERVGEFSYAVEDLFPGSEYFVRAYIVLNLANALQDGAVHYTEDIPVTTLAADPQGFRVSEAPHADYVELLWEPIDGAMRYILFRDGTEIARAMPGESSYQDTGAEAGGTPGAPQNVEAVGTHDDVRISWDEVQPGHGTEHRYHMVVLYSSRTSEFSDEITGYRTGEYPTHYELQINGGVWQNIGDTLSFDDSSAPATVISVPGVSASQGTYTERVALQALGEADVTSTSLSYAVRAVSASGASEASEEVSASRTSGAVEYQWERSAASSDADYSALSGATDVNFDDLSAPEDGSQRYYRLQVSAEGAETVYSDAAIGYRAATSDVSTASVTDVNTDGATLRGALNALGAPAPSAHGFCYGTHSSPSHSSGAICFDMGAASSTGDFSHAISGLEAGTQYFVRAFATNHVGTTYGDNENFWTVTDAPQVSTTVRASFITVSWNPVPGAVKYVLSRDGEELAVLDAPQASFNDTEAGQPTAPGTVVIDSITDGDLTDGVKIEWSAASSSAGALHEYKVVALNADDLASEPGTASGQLRARPINSYEIKIGDGPWTTVDTSKGLEYLDTDALKGEITAGPISASKGDSPLHVVLESSVLSVSMPEYQTYFVRARNSAGAGVAASQEGRRGVDNTHHFQWFASDTGAQGQFSALFNPATTTDNNYNDTGANADGSDRLYYVEITVAGAETFTSDTIDGYRAADAEVSTQAASNVEATTATLHGTLVATGRPYPTQHGFCYGAMSQPNHKNGATCTTQGAKSDAGAFTYNATGLDAGTEYFVRSFATNNAGTVYGNAENFWTYAEVVTGVTATAKVNSVEVNWNAADGAAKYRVYRQGPLDVDPVFVGEVDAPADSLTDTDVEGGAPNQVVLTTPAQKHPDHVRLEWTNPGVQDGDTYEYTVVSVNGGGNASQASAGNAAAPQGAAIDSYELEIDGSDDWVDIGNALFYNDSSAPAGSVTAGAITVELGVHLSEVALSSISPSVADGATQSYRVRAVHKDAADASQTGAASDSETSNRIVENVSYLWERTAEDNIHAAYASLPMQCADELSCGDSTAASGEYYYYRLKISADGADDAYSTPARGALAVLHLAFSLEPDATITASDEFNVAVQLVNQFDDAFSIENIPVSLELNQNTFAGGGTTVGPVNTDENGQALFEDISITKAATDYALDATSTDALLSGKNQWSEAFDVVPGTATVVHSSISGTSSAPSDGDTDAVITIVLKDAFENPLVDVVPTFSATGLHNSLGTCSETNEDGESTCTMKSLSWGEKTLTVTGPAEVLVGDPITGTVTFDYFCAGSVFQVGDGTADAPYTVCNAEQLNSIGASYNTSHFIQMADIDLSAIANFNMVGETSSNVSFTGSYDGNGYTISNLTIDKESLEYVGMFRRTGNASLKNIRLIDVDIKGGSFVGGLVGSHNSGSITSSYVTGSVSGDSFVGGLLGTSNGDVSSSYATGSVNSGGNYVGGLLGYHNSGSITSSYATGSVHSDGNFVGGLVGYHNGGSITSSYATGSVSGDGFVGGLVGIDNSGSITNSYRNANAECTNDNCNSLGTGLSYEDMTSQDDSKFAGFGFVDNADELPEDWKWIGCGTPRLAWEDTSDVVCPCEPAADFWDGPGDGSADNPYQICSPAHLNAIGNDYLIAHFVLVEDLDLTDIANFNYIGTDLGNPFTGSFDGQGYTISNLKIDASGSNYVGMFGVLATGGEVKNIGLSNVEVSGNNYVGGLAGQSEGSIDASYVMGDVSGSYYVGGLAGYHEGSITSSYATGNISGKNGFVGGLVGTNDGGTIESSYATGDVSGNSNVGGLVGINSGSITNSYRNSDAVCTGCNNALGTARTYEEMTSQDDSHFAGFGFVGNVDELPEDWKWIGCGTPRLTWEDLDHEVECACDPNENFWNGPGDGSAEDPYQICSADQLNSIGADYNDSHFIQMADIDLGDIPNFNMIGGAGPSTAFTGGYNGNGYTISSLTIDEGSLQYVGMFRITDNAILNTIQLIDVDITGGSFVGGLLGSQIGGSVTSSYVTGSVSGGGDYVGGLIGVSQGVITSSYATSSVNGGTAVGGLLGLSQDSSITSSYATGSVSGGDAVGGLVGGSQGGSITSSHATGAVSGDGFAVGGLVGDLSSLGFTPIYTSITSSYATGSVSGAGAAVGGLVGYQRGGGITSSYATGSVSGEGDYVGGLVGLSQGVITSSYATGVVNGHDSVGGLIGLASASDVTSSDASGTVSGNIGIGGLIGRVDNSVVTLSFASGTVSGASQVGGLVGRLSDSDVTSSYASGAASGTTSAVGGLVGRASGSDVTSSYASGAVSGTSAVGGLVGQQHETTLKDSYRNTDAECTNDNCNELGTGLSWEDMTSQDDAKFAGFGFVGNIDELPEDWKWIGCGTPRLEWEDLDPEVCD